MSSLFLDERYTQLETLNNIILCFCLSSSRRNVLIEKKERKKNPRLNWIISESNNKVFIQQRIYFEKVRNIIKWSIIQILPRKREEQGLGLALGALYDYYIYRDVQFRSLE